MSSEAPEISIVMPLRNEAATLGRTLDAVLSQVVDASFEVVAAEGRSSDDTLAILERRRAEDPRLRIVDNAHGGTPQALNCALRAARGRYVVRIDGHSHVPPDFVQRLVDHLRSGQCEAVGGLLRAVGSTPFGRAVAVVHGSPLGLGNARHHYSNRLEYVDHVAFPAYVTERVRALGGWDEEFVRNQDYELDYRYGLAGGRILLDPSLVFDWDVRESPRELAGQYFQYGFWKLRALARHPSSLHLRWLVPPTLVLALVAGLASSWTLPGRIVLATAGGSYALFVVGSSLMLARSSAGPRSAPRIAAALVVVQLSWATGFLVSAARLASRSVLRRLRWGGEREPAQGAPVSRGRWRGRATRRDPRGA
jgi:succinoglycan biosynthesis protein ExoA